jgi:hypothetical protein
MASFEDVKKRIAVVSGINGGDNEMSPRSLLDYGANPD